MHFHHDTTWLAVHHFTLELMQCHQPEAVFRYALPQLEVLLRAPYISLDLLEGNTELVTYAATPGQPLEVGDRMKRGKGGWLSWQAIDDRRTLTLDSYATWDKRRALHESFAIQAILITPLCWHTHVVGALNLLRLEPEDPFTPGECDLAELLAQSVMVALKNAQTLASQPATTPSPLDALSARQQEVLFWVAQGFTYQQVGDKVGITERTVKFHMQAILRQLGGLTRRQAVALACAHLPRSVIGPTPAHGLGYRQKAKR